MQMTLINDEDFSDIYITPQKDAFIWSKRSAFGLTPVDFDDFKEFLSAVEKGYDGEPSYLLIYKDYNYRVERSLSLYGVQYCVRKMPKTVPSFATLGFPPVLAGHLLSLGRASGLLLVSGATGSGKSTTLASLLKEFLVREGGYAFTIENPIEMPLDGIYKSAAGDFGLCKQTNAPKGMWEEGLKSALRSAPRYILLGEIRTPEVACMTLQAAMSGHLILSTIHANSVPDAVNALVKYAASGGVNEDMAYELVAGSLLGCIHQTLVGVPKRLRVSSIFANPDVSQADQVRNIIKSGKLNFATVMESQNIKMINGKPLFLPSKY